MNLINLLSLSYTIVSCFIQSVFSSDSTQSRKINLFTNGNFSESNTWRLKHPRSDSALYPLPELQIKLENGTVLQVENSPVILSQKVGSVELICTADYPIKWEYLVKNKTIPVLDVIYRRLIRNMTEFTNPKGNRFMSLVKLKGLLESQSGKYLCRNYNDKLENNSYAISSYVDIFIPGGKTFNTISSVKFINKTDPYVDIHCPVTDPKTHVTLYKLNEKHYMKTGKLIWKSIHANYEPTDGFRLLSGLGRELLGTYNCNAITGKSFASVIVDVADITEKDLYLSSSPVSSDLSLSCWENSTLMRFIRSQRLECFCKDSYGLFVNDESFQYENRHANCSSHRLMQELEKCNDWRLKEYFESPEETQEICFRNPITVVKGSDKSGSRPSLFVNGKTFPEGDDQWNFSLSKLNITYNGFVDWAGDFMLAICRSEVCHVEFNEDGSFRKSEEKGSLEFLENEPAATQYFPMAHYQAKWKDVFVNGSDVKRIYVFQAHSLSYSWFYYSTKEIKNGSDYDYESSDDNDQSSLSPQVGQKNPLHSSPESGEMSDSSSTSSSASTTAASTFHCGINDPFRLNFVFILVLQLPYFLL